MTRCDMCGSELKKEHVDIVRYWGKELIALENVPAMVCKQCGERYFEAKVSAEVDIKIKTVLKGRVFDDSVRRISVPILSF